jgi:hypothetical protein
VWCAGRPAVPGRWRGGSRGGVSRERGAGLVRDIDSASIAGGYN